jgi:hypothetical protein
MVKIIEAPSSIGVALGILDAHISAVPRSREIAPPRRLGARTVGVVRWRQRELQFLEKDRSVGKYIRLLVFRVRARLDVDVVKFGEAGVTAIERIRSERGSNVNPFMKILRQD